MDEDLALEMLFTQLAGELLEESKMVGQRCSPQHQHHTKYNFW